MLENLLVKSHNKDQPKDVDFSLFWEAWNLVNDKYVDKSKLNKTEMIYGAISGMVKSLGDPFSGFMDPEANQQFSLDMEGTFTGVGIEIGIKNDILTVIAPLEGTPADQAGLKAGDKIIKIDDLVAADMTIDKAVSKIRGPKGSEVILTVLREDDGSQPREIKIVRDTINVKSVKLELRDDNIAYIRISRFGNDTATEMNRAASKIIAKKSKGIILDLRNNPGGYLEAAVDVSSKFISRDKIVVMEEMGDGSRKNHKSRGKGILGNVPIVVLVNGGSASSSEIVAGALRDNIGAELVGKKTFGKGSVQELERLSGGSSLRITVAKWLTPNGEYIMEKGISPDFEVDLTKDDYNNDRDPQLDKAIEVLKEKMK